MTLNKVRWSRAVVSDRMGVLCVTDRGILAWPAIGASGCVFVPGFGSFVLGAPLVLASSSSVMSLLCVNLAGQLSLCSLLYPEWGGSERQTERERGGVAGP